MDTPQDSRQTVEVCHSVLDSRLDVYLFLFVAVAVIVIATYQFRARLAKFVYYSALDRSFDAADANGDGLIDLGEIHAAVLLLYTRVPGIKVVPPSRKVIEAAVFANLPDKEANALDRAQYHAAMGVLLPQFLYRSIGTLVLLPLSAFLGQFYIDPFIRFAHSLVDIPWIENIEDKFAAIFDPCEMAVLRSALPALFWLFDQADADVIVPIVSVAVASCTLLPFLYDRADAMALRKFSHSSKKIS